jgi:hypothetical protein
MRLRTWQPHVTEGLSMTITIEKIEAQMLSGLNRMASNLENCIIETIIIHENVLSHPDFPSSDPMASHHDLLVLHIHHQRLINHIRHHAYHPSFNERNSTHKQRTALPGGDVILVLDSHTLGLESRTVSSEL